MSQPLQIVKDCLHISHSQIFTYLNCSQKYKYQYVEQRPIERISIALPFGKAIHTAAECYYLSVKDGDLLSLDMLQNIFKESLLRNVESVSVPILFKKDTLDMDSALSMGKRLVEVFYENVNLIGYQIVGIELPLTALIHGPDGDPLDIQLVGFIDLLLKDDKGRLLIVDLKTSKQKKSQSTVDDDLQMTVYSYLLAANRYIFPKARVDCRFDVLRKLKKPMFENYYTSRGPEERKKFSKLAVAVLEGIDNRVFIPCKSWMCADCGYQTACKEEW